MELLHPHRRPIYYLMGCTMHHLALSSSLVSSRLTSSSLALSSLTSSSLGSSNLFSSSHDSKRLISSSLYSSFGVLWLLSSGSPLL